MQEKDYDVVVVGAGIAGLTAALYTSRQGLRTLVIGKNLGGQALMAPVVGNYPGLPSVEGLALIERVKDQVESFGAVIVFDEVKGIDADPSRFNIRTIRDVYTCPALILASGKTPRDMLLADEERFKGRGISYCTICDGPLFKGRTVAVFGSGQMGLESVAYLSELASEVFYVTRERKLIGDQGLIDRISHSGVVVTLTRSEVVGLIGDSRLRSIDVRNLDDDSRNRINLDGLFVELGYVTKTDPFRKLVEINDKGEIIVDRLCHTSTEGVFAAGDVTDMPHKQMVIAAGLGAICGLEAVDFMLRKEGKPPIGMDWKKLEGHSPSLSP